MRLVGASILVGITSFGLHQLAGLASASFVVQVEMSTDVPGTGQVFIATSRSDYSEPRSIKFPIIPDGEKHKYEASFKHAGTPRFVRIDPGDAPGTTRIHSVRMTHGGSSFRISGTELGRAIKPLNQIGVEPATVHGVALQASGGDPYFEIDVPGDLPGTVRMQRFIGGAIALLGITGLLALAWVSRREITAFAGKSDWIAGFGTFAASAGMVLVLLAALGLGTSGGVANGLAYGLPLLFACLCFFLVGEAVLKALDVGRCASGRLFLSVVVGQAVLIAYFYLRSAINAVAPFLPVTAIELFGLVLLCGVFLHKCGWRPASREEGGKWPLFELGVLAALCVTVAARELPRVLMLSSDPDTHAYFARQAEILGAIPWRGENVFQYPGGSAATTFLWAKLSFLDVRNALTALPLLQTFLAVLVLAELLALRIRPLPARCTIVLVALGIAAAGLLLPIYPNYGHMEGTARQIAIAFMGLSIALMLTGDRTAASDWRRMPLVLASLFALGMLNPVNTVVPGILVGGYSSYVLLVEKRLSPLPLALLALPASLLLDPYYASLLPGGASHAPKVPLIGAYETKGIAEILNGWLSGPDPSIQFLKTLPGLLPNQSHPLFLVLLLIFGVPALVLSRRIGLRWQFALSALLVLAVLLAVNDLFFALRNDSRYFLLAPYFQFNLTQHKTLLLPLVAATAILAASTKGLRAAWLLLLAIAMIAATAMATHRTQRLVLDPRADYCGSLGCITESDISVLRQFEKYTATEVKAKDGRDGTRLPKVLVPNSVHRTDKELWVFPVAGARATPFFDVLPTAFFYYQGDDDFTSATYLEHVCRHFDRSWLKQQGIEYLFLPANRGPACLAGMEALPKDEAVVARVGNSYLLRIR